MITVDRSAQQEANAYKDIAGLLSAIDVRIVSAHRLADLVNLWKRRRPRRYNSLPCNFTIRENTASHFVERACSDEKAGNYAICICMRANLIITQFACLFMPWPSGFQLVMTMLQLIITKFQWA